MNIFGKRIILRAIEVDDIPLLHKWSNDPDVTGGLGDVNFPSSLYQQELWFKGIQHDKLTIRLAIQSKEGVLIGQTGFWNIHWRDRRAEHGLIIGDNAYLGKEYGKEVILTCARYAFEELGFHRLDATILEINQASQNAYLACGFQVEGIIREHALRGGKRINRIILGLLATDYYTMVKNTGYWNTSGD